MMIDMDDPDHLRRRKLVNKGFTPQRVRAQRDRVREVVDGLVDAVIERGSCDLVTDIAGWLPLVMIGDALGVAPEDHPTLLQWSDDLMKGQGQTDETLLMAMIGAFDGYSSYIAEVIADRRGCPRDDLMSILCHAEVDGDRLDDDAVLHESLLILIGGDETTRHVITGGLYQLLTNGRSGWERLLADRSLIPSAVEESLRWVRRSRTWPAPPPRTSSSTASRSSAGREAPAALPVGQPRRVTLRRPDDVRHRTDAQRPRRLRLRQPLLPRVVARPPRADRGVRDAARPSPGSPPRP